MHLEPSLSKQRNDQPNDVKKDGSTNLFSGDCNQLKFVSGDFKKEFGMPIYDEYEDEYFSVVPKNPPIEFVISRLVSEENLTVIWGQKTEKRKDNEGARGDCLPLCYSSFELIKQRLKASIQKHKFEDMVHFMNMFEIEDDEDEQSCSPSPLMDRSVVCNKASDYKERGEGSQINTFLKFSHSEISSHEEGLCVPDSAGEKNDMSAKAYKKGEVLNSEILNESVDI